MSENADYANEDYAALIAAARNAIENRSLGDALECLSEMIVALETAINHNDYRDGRFARVYLGARVGETLAEVCERVMSEIRVAESARDGTLAALCETAKAVEAAVALANDAARRAEVAEVALAPLRKTLERAAWYLDARSGAPGHPSYEAERAQMLAEVVDALARTAKT